MPGAAEEGSMKRLTLIILFVMWTGAASPGQAQFKTLSTVDSTAIQGRPVELGEHGNLLPWPRPHRVGESYAAYFLSRWKYLQQQYSHQRYYDFYCCINYDRETFMTYPDRQWANSTGYLRAMMEGFIEHLYPYTGDPRTLAFLKDLVDYELENGTTPITYAWAGVPYDSADPGARRYTGWNPHGVDYIEPPVVGEDGYGYVRLYQMTGITRYLRAAIRCADALAKNQQPGDAKSSPWPFRCYARDARPLQGGQRGDYSAAVIGPIMLFDELIRLQSGDVAAYRRARRLAWDWLMRYPMKNNVWSGYFEDVTPNMANMNNVIPLETARYLILHPETDANWRQDAARLIEWVKTTPKWPKYIVHGALVTTEQGDGVNFCCQKPGWCCDSHTARLAAEALYYSRTDDASYRDAAFRSYNWITYFQGFPPKGHTPWGNGQWWFTDEFADGPRRLMDGLWAVPEWAPAGQTHFLGSSSVVTGISYGQGRVTYSTFDATAVDVLRLDFNPARVAAAGRYLQQVSDIRQPGYTYEASTSVMRIHHLNARHVDVEGTGGRAPAGVVDFDNPVLAANTILAGEYPSGMINWGDKGEWKIGVPEGRLATFNLAPADPHSQRAGLSFDSPKVFLGMMAYNRSGQEVTLKVHAPNAIDVRATIPAGKLIRIETGWALPVPRVSFQIEGKGSLADLRFDDLSYSNSNPIPTGIEDATLP
jgi:hypothetical protein